MAMVRTLEAAAVERLVMDELRKEGAPVHAVAAGKLVATFAVSGSPSWFIEVVVDDDASVLQLRLAENEMLSVAARTEAAELAARINFNMRQGYYSVDLDTGAVGLQYSLPYLGLAQRELALTLRESIDLLSSTFRVSTPAFRDVGAGMTATDALAGLHRVLGGDSGPAADAAAPPPYDAGGGSSGGGGGVDDHRVLRKVCGLLKEMGFGSAGVDEESSKIVMNIAGDHCEFRHIMLVDATRAVLTLVSHPMDDAKPEEAVASTLERFASRVNRTLLCGSFALCRSPLDWRFISHIFFKGAEDDLRELLELNLRIHMDTYDRYMVHVDAICKHGLDDRTAFDWSTGCVPSAALRCFALFLAAHYFLPLLPLRSKIDWKPAAAGDRQSQQL
eukprot:PLAT6438.1.p1 GENE.PLAT6438.1~~PLAT6438.1.p1  ORF type:complete len:390 (+),score=144.23 PLAT6438.1:87-1256(+)